MATTINLVKESAEADTPLLFFECILPGGGGAHHWCTHAISFNGQPYGARVLKHNLFDLQLSADDAMDGITKLSITLADADAYLAELNAGIGFKGSQLTVHFAFADLPSGVITTESTVLFRGIAGDPDEISEDSLTVTFSNKLSLQRVPIPEVRIQRSCPWSFPSTSVQRTEAENANPENRFSPFYRCGYSADVPGGVGNLMSNGQAYTSCSKSRPDCQARGMFNIDNANRTTARFGGFEFVPSAVTVRTSGSSTTHLSPLLDNSAKYNDPVPIVYGQGWLKAPVIFSRNDGNLTHMEVVLGMGQIGASSFDGVLKLVVNDVEIPKGVSGQDMTTTGSYKVFTAGARNGNFNRDFLSNGQPLGDPYGSMAAVSIVVPNRISSGTSLPNVQVLLQGVQVDSYNLDGSFLETIWSDNPAWVILDVLRRCGWSTEDLNLSTFAASAEYCSTSISATALSGQATSVARYKCNLILTKRQSAAVVVRGIRVASSLMLRYGATGLLELLPETSIQGQQPALVFPDGGNSLELLNDGWPAYEFSDGFLSEFSGIVRNANGSSTLRFTSRSIAETSNRLSVEFQDESNEYQQDSLSVVDGDDAGLLGYEISSQSTALGIANFSQATRVLLQQLDKTINGNLFVEFQTSFRALKVRPGDIIAVSSSRPILAGALGSTRIPFRVVKLSPSVNYELVTILAQIHDDNWYSDNPAVLGGAGRQPSSQVQTPRPLIGLVPHPRTGKFEFFDFDVSEAIQAQSGNTADVLTVKFSQPSKPSANAPSLPMLSLSPDIETAGGTLPASTNFYYAVSALDATMNEGPLSFTVLAQIESTTNTNSVTIAVLAFPPGAMYFNVYRGTTPQMLYQIASGIQIPALNGQPVTYPDTGANGAVPNPVGPPDANFDHANFYWRYEYSSAYLAGTFTATTIGTGTGDSWATPNVYIGKLVRILEGTGTGQERPVVGNDDTTLTVSPRWSVVPDATSTFVVTEGSWRFAAVSATSPVQFEIPYRTGDAIQISGRGANVNNQEGTADLCPLTRWTLGQQQSTNNGVPPTPSFEIAAPGGGDVTLDRIGFDNTAGSSSAPNTDSISSGTLQLFYWNEVNPPNPYSLSAPLDAFTTTFSPGVLVKPTNPPPSYILQIGSEIMAIISIDSVANTYTVQRAVLGSSPESHAPGDPVMHLDTSFVVVPFSPKFFGNSASINYIHTFSLPDKRIAAAEFFVTNSFGDSPTAFSYFAADNNGDGLRTLSGGQFSLQVSGYLATQQNAAPPLVISDSSHAVRDARAAVGQAASGYNISVDILQNGLLYCNLTVGAGRIISQITNGVNLPPLLKDATLTMNVALQLVGTSTTSPSPGRDLTVTIRL